MTNQKFSVGDKVEWVSSGVKKIGEIIAVVPAGKTPAEIGYPKAGGGGEARDHETYVARGVKQDSKGALWLQSPLLAFRQSSDPHQVTTAQR
ncbi:hypothetical protein DXT96_06805 [Agrobacterium sp. ICMP 6402]|uniref:hypothetical protein n=1 Tax=Agrobacterium sp. ICMP 6402 TaxID=2292443 RepID=UPI001297F5A9|nr:hypothetical protein [Agrobacterium sp. ICMP 6402]MQB09564.1 hypothetical protein [Agrobacterium sp. ICMP 6402]